MGLSSFVSFLRGRICRGAYLREWVSGWCAITDFYCMFLIYSCQTGCHTIISIYSEGVKIGYSNNHSDLLKSKNHDQIDSSREEQNKTFAQNSKIR